jgi:small subunit ribosomal protein S4e
MVRGPKKHMKRLNAPKHWMLAKMGGIWAPKPTSGPHKSRECLPLSIILRTRLKYALTRKESMMIAMQRLVKVDGKVRTEINFPAGFMDVVHIEKSNDTFRLMYDTKGRFLLHSIGAAEASYKLARVVNSGTTSKSIPYIVTHDGRTIRYPDPLIKVHDTVKIDLATGKVIDFVKHEVGNLVFVTRGRNAGRIGVMQARDKHPGSFDIVHVKDAIGNVFATRLSNAFIVGKGADAKAALISLPKGAGIKKSIFEERDAKKGSKN